MFIDLSGIIFFVLPIALVLAFIIYYGKYCEAKKVNRENPGTYSEEEMKKKKLIVTILGIIAGVFVSMVVGLLVLLFGAIAFM